MSHEGQGHTWRNQNISFVRCVILSDQICLLPTILLHFLANFKNMTLTGSYNGKGQIQFGFLEGLVQSVVSSKSESIN